MKNNSIKKNKIKELLIDFIGITIGCAVAGIGMNMFLIPNQIAAGGVSGLGIILLYVLGIPVGATVLGVNVPLLFVEAKIMGFNYTIRTVYGALMFSFLIEVFSFVPNFTGDIFLSAIYGGIILGIGLGLVFRNRGTTGGTALAAQLLQKYTGLTIGQAIIGFDMIIIVLSAIFFDAEVALYALISLFVASKTLDMVQQGFRQTKAALIISNKSKEISQEIFSQLNRGVTNITARGGYTGEDREMILVVVNRTELSRLKSLVYSTDENSFVIVSEANEVLGEGFKAVEQDDL
ncbi:YitT family protein [Natranaerobius trueperi]|nr:YitT family protein [Natranaerobius trueperi]